MKCSAAPSGPAFPQASNDYEFRFPGCIEDFGDSANANHSLKKLVKKVRQRRQGLG